MSARVPSIGQTAAFQRDPLLPGLLTVSSIVPCPLPPDALLQAYLRDGAYTDCYVTDIAQRVSHVQYVEAFYTTPVFRLERLLLAWFVAKPCTDAHARQLADGAIDAFAAWQMEGRSANPLLLCDYAGSTRSRLMTVPHGADEATTRRSRIGGGAAATQSRRPATLAVVFRGLLGFHTLYSRVLFGAARRRLAKLER